MGGKHLKRKRTQKSKVQLKKKKLGKGQNITDISFKVQKILIVEQLRKVDGHEPLSNWNITLKDLLTHLNHYNFTSRLNGLSGIKEILTNYPEVLCGPSLKPLTCKLFELITDEEHKIRVIAMNLISHVLSLLPNALIVPFYELLNIHLVCAMTHRNTFIQQDSIKFIDVVIKHSPEALKHNLQIIAQNFLRIIKTVLCQTQTGEFSLKGPKQELEKAKTEMLNRFYQFIEACYSITDIKDSSLGSFDKNDLEKQKISLRDLYDCYKIIPNLPNLFKKIEGKGSIINGFDSAEIKSLCSLVMPVLFDTWTEFAPNWRSDVGTSECVLTGSTGELLCVLLKTMLLLYEKVAALQDPQMENWFISNYNQTFRKSFTSNFPYFPSVSKNRSKSSNNSEISARDSFNSCMLQNLIICYLAYSFKLVHKNNDLETKVEHFIACTISMKNLTEIDALTKVVEAAVNSSNHRKSNILNLVTTALNSTGHSELWQRLSKVLTRVVLGENFHFPQKDCNISNWVLSLPQRLCDSQVFVHEVETISKIIVKPSGTEVLQKLELKAEEILENLPNIEVRGVDKVKGQRMIACLLYRCNNGVLNEIIEKVLSSQKFSGDLRNYILEIFCHKLGRHVDFC